MFETRILTFNSVESINDTVIDTIELREQIEQARLKIQEFNEREQTFSQQISEYPQLDTLDKQFDPFHKLLEVAFNVNSSLTEWTNQPLANQDYENMESSINEWIMRCF